MKTEVRKPVAPFYAVAVLWIVYALLFPLYAPAHYALLTAASAWDKANRLKTRDTVRAWRTPSSMTPGVWSKSPISFGAKT